MGRTTNAVGRTLTRVKKMSRKIVTASGGLLIVGLLCWGAAGALFCAATLHVQKKLGDRPPGASTVSVAARDGAALSAWWMKSAHSNGNCVVVLHGIADSRVGSSGFAPMFLNEGYSVLLPDSRGHGASAGAFVTYGLLEKYDVIVWADWLKRAGCVKVYGLGESLGASVLVQSASVRPVFAAIVAECPFANLEDAAAYRLRRFMDVPGIVAKTVIVSANLYARLVDGLNLRLVSPLLAIKKSFTPILLIHGLADVRMPPSDSMELARANPRDRLWLVQNAVHTGAATAAPAEFRRRVLAWFAEH